MECRALALAAALIALPALARAAESCGEVVSLQTHGSTTMRYAFARPSGPPTVTVVLLPGGAGHLDLDERGCPRRLIGNSLVRSIPLFHELGFATALVDAPSDHAGSDGLAGFRTNPRHADDIGKAIADVRARTNTPVWLIGTSRGAISAANAASRLAGPPAPDGLVLTSALMLGDARAKRAWVTQSVFDLPLEAIRMPVLVVGHEVDTCIRSPAKLMGNITARTNGAREQVVVVTGGLGGSGLTSTEACEGRSPHGFLEQEREVAAGIARFIREGKY